MQKASVKNGKTTTAKKKVRDPIPERFESLEAAAEFWDTHDLSDYRDEFREVKDVKIQLAPRHVRLENELAGKISQLARRRGVSSETLVHLWLQQKLADTLKRNKRRTPVPAKRATISQYA